MDIQNLAHEVLKLTLEKMRDVLNGNTEDCEGQANCLKALSTAAYSIADIERAEKNEAPDADTSETALY